MNKVFGLLYPFLNCKTGLLFASSLKLFTSERSKSNVEKEPGHLLIYRREKPHFKWDFSQLTGLIITVLQSNRSGQCSCKGLNYF